MKLSTQAFSSVSMYLLTRAGFKKKSFHNPNDLYKAGSYILQGRKKVSSGSPGRVDFLAGQVTLKGDLPKGPSKSSSNNIIN